MRWADFVGVKVGVRVRKWVRVGGWRRGRERAFQSTEGKKCCLHIVGENFVKKKKLHL